VSVDGKIFTYYLLFAAVALLFLALLRIVNSPFGRVLQAIRENDFRAEAIGFRTVVYRTWSNVLSALFATHRRRAAGAVAALRGARHHAELRDHARHPAHRRHRRHGHDVRRGGRRGAVRAGAELPAGPAEAGRRALEGVPVLSAWSRPDRWLLWLGVLFVLSVYHFPTGIVGRLRALASVSLTEGLP
jgi:branched-chain amino acid transport system permease protein